MSLEDDLEQLEAEDPAVRAAAELLADTTRAILRRARAADPRPRMPGAESTSASLRRVEAELGSALAKLGDRERELALAMDELAGARQDNDRLRERVVELTGRLAFRPRLPETDEEVCAWYAERGLALSCGPAVLFAALRRDFNQTKDPT